MSTNPEAGPASNDEILQGLNDLLQLNHDAIGAYNVAIEKLEDRDHATQIGGFRLDHERHVRELSDAIQRLGGEPRNEPHATGPLKEAMQGLGALGGDRGVLMAWRVNERQVRTRYDAYAARAMHWPADLKRMVDQQALDEERHYEWVAGVLEAMGAGEGAGAAVADRVREQLGGLAERAQGATARAREQVGAAAGSARIRAADGLERAAGRLDELADRQGQAGGARSRAAGAAHRVAGGVAATADYLRTPDVEVLRRDVEQQVRAAPVRTLAAAFGIGFVIGRILR